MLHIILLILKIIGIIIAVILGLAVALLLIVLFVPIRYVIDAGWSERYMGRYGDTGEFNATCV